MLTARFTTEPVHYLNNIFNTKLSVSGANSCCCMKAMTSGPYRHAGCNSRDNRQAILAARHTTATACDLEICQKT